ncbi:MAG: sulfite exporter TauE/SafE family protein [Deltaproteobacteria bacterium]|nr:sulfite exporter TauE/SafE family protein [Deltaproteobacteria bacterium]
MAALTALIFLAAALYASVGHAGASGYLAAMALVGVAPAQMKPTALVLNLLVASVATWRFSRAGCFSWRVLWPFAVTSVPMAFVGGMLAVPSRVYKPALGAVLVVAAARLLWSPKAPEAPPAEDPPRALALASGAVIGLLSGLTGVGGGIFLSPLLVLTGWASLAVTAGVSAAFILLNSAAGLLGHLSSVRGLHPWTPPWAVAALLGGALGASYGSRHLGGPYLRRALALVLVVAGLKLLASRS